MDVEQKAATVAQDVEKGMVATKTAVKSARSARKMRWWCCGITTVILVIVAIVIVFEGKASPLRVVVLSVAPLLIKIGSRPPPHQEEPSGSSRCTGIIYTSSTELGHLSFVSRSQRRSNHLKLGCISIDIRLRPPLRQR